MRSTWRAATEATGLRTGVPLLLDGRLIAIEPSPLKNFGRAYCARDNSTSSQPQDTFRREIETSLSAVDPSRLNEQGMTSRQLMRVPGGKPVTDSLFTDLRFGHGSDEFVMNEQAIDVKRLVTHRVSGVELNCLTPFRVLNACEQRCLK